ncbi:MAG: zinc ribbon domain-containing protein [Coriobacteriia bacterium]|nr:zinc ribbon domain-containing protein [Coriobacteriia bacterium]
MPAYDYRCPSCDHVFEVVRSFADREDVMCPSCATTAKRLFTPVGVVFKGSGFHNTDYRPRPTSEESSPAGKDSCPSSSSTDSCASRPAASAPVGD